VLDFNALTTAANIKFDALGAITTLNLPVLAVLPGYFKLSETSVTILSLPSLTSLGGDFTVVDNHILTMLSAPNLPAVSGNVAVNGNIELLTLDLSMATSIGSYLEIKRNWKLASAKFDMLAVVSTYVTIEYNYLLTSFSAPVLTSVSGDFIIDNNGITTLNAPMLTSTLNFEIYSNADLQTATLTGVTEITGRLNIHDCSALTAVDLSSLATIDDEVIISSTGLTSLSLPDLTDIGTDAATAMVAFDISENPTLTSLSLPSFVTIGSGKNIRVCANAMSFTVPVALYDAAASAMDMCSVIPGADACTNTYIACP